jgi:hypothetical protein
LPSRDRIDGRFDDFFAVTQRLRAKARQQVIAGDSLGKSRVIVRTHDQRSAACVRIDDGAAPETPR